MPRPAPLTALPLLFLLLAVGAGSRHPAPAGQTAPAGAGDSAPPPARALSRALTRVPRLAGTPGSQAAIELVARTLEEAGFTVTRDRREVLLTYPRHLVVEARVPGRDEPLFRREDRFDPEAVPAADVPLYNAWSASGTVEGTVVDVGRGLRADYERLARDGVEVRGHIALARYGGAYRGVKAREAEEAGCAGLLLFNDPSSDGPGRGTIWPDGPWKPGWDAERGAISSLTGGPGDPTTPGWPSPAPGEAPPPGHARLEGTALAARLPRIPVLPLGADHALRLLEHPEARVRLAIDEPRRLATITNVLGRLEGKEPGLVLAGNHRDAWVRGANDAGSGTVSLLRAAQRLGERVRNGWQPRRTIVLGFWDAEEFGLIGSTEWGEAHAADLADAVAYVNADSAVSGLQVGLSGTPGLEDTASAALARVPSPLQGSGKTLLDDWHARAGATPTLAPAGSGSDFTVFLHRLGVPVLDVSFGGNAGGQYHTTFDDFETMDRWLDPTWQGHETAGRLLAELLAELTERGPSACDDAALARAMAGFARKAGQEVRDGEPWLGAERGERLAAAFETLAGAIDSAHAAGTAPAVPNLLRALLRKGGLPDRPWFRNPLWAPGLESGYAAETFPTLRTAAREGDAALGSELQRMTDDLAGLAREWAAPAAGTASGEGARR